MREESGRSMVEMLGTLAMIGVLSVVGLSIYKHALNSHRANEIINSVSLMSLMASNQLSLNGTFSLGEFNNQTSNGYPVEELIYGKEPIFGIRVKELPADICKKVMSMGWKAPKEIAIGGVAVTDGDTCNDNVDIDFIFPKNLEADDYEVERCGTGKTCSSVCDTCVDGVCQENCAEGTSCVYRQNGRQMDSNKTMCCPNERVMNGICCNSVKYDATTGEKLCCTSSSTCCPEGQFWASTSVSASGKCYSCNEPDYLYVSSTISSTERCAVCENRVLDGWYCRLNSCIEDDQVIKEGICYCPDDKPVMDTNGYCHSCNYSSNGVWRNFPTLFLKASGYTADNCAAAAWCGNRNCSGGYTRRCSANQIGQVYTTSNRFKLTDSSTPSAGTCHDCSTVNLSTIKFEAQCKICGGTWSGTNWYTGSCTSS